MNAKLRQKLVIELAKTSDHANNYYTKDIIKIANAIADISTMSPMEKSSDIERGLISIGNALLNTANHLYD